MSNKLTGYPSIDKPWLKYYPEEAINMPLPDGTAYDYLYQKNKSRDKTALEYVGNKVSYQKMFENINIVERAFIHYGIKEGDIVTVSIPNMPEAAYIFYALSKIGAVSNMVDPRTSVASIKEYIEETNSKMVIMIDVAIQKVIALKDKIPFLKTVVSVSPSFSFPAPVKLLYNMKNKIDLPSGVIDWKDFFASGKSGQLFDVDNNKNAKDKPVLIVHTGGTTGSPKGVVLSNLNINARAFQSVLFPTETKSTHRWLDIMPPFIAYGIGSGLHFPLTVGMEVILIPKFDPDKFDELLIKYKPNQIAGVPSHWYTVINSRKMQNQDLSYLVTAGVGGDSMDEKLEKDTNSFLEKHHCRYKITKGYGMTETNGSVCRTYNDNNPIGTVGIPFSHSVISVFDPETLEELPYNKTGELCLSGPSIMLGYYNNPEETNKIKKNHHGREWIHSGDVGYITEDGNIFILNRIKRMIIRYDGFKIFPSMIEKALLTHKDVVSCCVVGAHDSEHNQGQLPVAYLVLSNKSGNNDIIRKQLFDICETELPEYAQPKDIVIKESLPLTSIGKVDYRCLEKEAESL